VICWKACSFRDGLHGFLWVWDAYWLHSCSNSSASGHFADRGEVPIPGWVEIVSVPAAVSKSFLNF